MVQKGNPLFLKKCYFYYSCYKPVELYMFIPKIIKTLYVIQLWRGLLFFCFRLLLLITIFSECTVAQPENNNYPVQFSLFIFSYPLVNPASMGEKSGNEVLLGYQKPVSGFSGVSTYFCNISFIPYRIKPTSKNKSVTGLRFYNDIEGAYINRSRFYGAYSFHTAINNRLNFSGGIDFGGMNFSVKSTPTTEGASVFRADASAGVWLYNNSFHVGLSISQLLNSVLKPLEEKTNLPAHFNLSGSITLYSNENVEITPHVLFTFPYYDNVSVRACLNGLLFKRIITAAGWNRKTNVSLMLGVNELQVFGNGLNVVVSYATSVGKASVSINRWEFSIAYRM